jgi:tRNA-splicing ligase RtcB
MSNLIQAEGSTDIRLWTPVEEVEASALKQLQTIARLPWVFHHVAVMPDVHFGIGATVGSVIAMKQAVSPAAVGVDIGCGMGAVLTNLNARDLPDHLGEIRSAIEKAIPVGFNWHKEPLDVGGSLQEWIKLLRETFDLLVPDVQGMKLGKGGVPTAVSIKTQAFQQMGTLGGGNHFIEMCLDKEDRVWLMLHSGSRGIGNQLAVLHIARAKKLAHNAELPDKDLSVFLAGTTEMAEYRRDLFWAQRYASLNRMAMMQLYREALEKFFPELDVLD